MKRTLRLAAGLLVSAACVWWAMREVRPMDVWLALGQADYRGFVAAMGLTLAGFWFRALRWRWLLSTPRPVRLRSLYSAVMIGFMANNLMPFRVGEFLRAWALGRRERLSKTTVFATVVVERVVDMIALLAIFGVALLLHPIASDTEAGRLTNAGAATLMAGCVALTILIVVLERDPAMLKSLIKRFSARLPARAREHGIAALERFIEGLGLFRDLPRLLWVFLLSFVMFGVFALCLQVCMWALGIRVPWYGGLLMLVMTAIGIMVPAAPGYVGTLNLACVAGLALFSVGKDQAVPFSWFYWTAQWLPVSVVGLYCLRQEGLSLRSLERVGEDAT